MSLVAPDAPMADPTAPPPPVLPALPSPVHPAPAAPAGEVDDPELWSAARVAEWVAALQPPLAARRARRL